MKPTGPLSILAAIALGAVHLTGGTALGQRSGVTSGTPAQATELEAGLTLRVYDIGRPMSRLAPLRPDQTPNADRILGTLDLPGADAFGGPGAYFVAHASGYLVIGEAGEHIFELVSDDGARLLIDDVRVIDHDGLHAAFGKEGRVRLNEGLHPFRVEMFQNEGGAALTLRWKRPGADAFEIVPAAAFRVEKGLTRVISPGRKVVLDGNEHLRPGSGMPVPGVHPMWTVETVRPAGVEHRIGGMDFLPDGSLVYSEFLPKNNGVLRTETNGSLWSLDSVSGGSGRAPAMPVRVADGFHDPSGVVCVGTDIYVSHRPGIELLRDTDGDGTYETRETFAAPWIGSNYHHFSFGLQHHTDEAGDWIYGTLSTSIYFDATLEGDPVEGEIIGMNGPNPPHRGSCYRINLETGQVEWLAGGLRTPNGILVDPDGDVFVADNQGAWHPANRLNHIKAGRFYGHYNGLQRSRLFPEGGARADYMEGGEWPPAVWLPQNEVSNSPTTPVEIPDGPFQGQYWLGELTAGGIRRVFLEVVNGELQGAVFRHTQGLESGVNRLVYGADGCLYMGGTGADGNWNWRGTQYGLQRLRPTGRTAFEYRSISATHNGLVVRLTAPAEAGRLANPTLYTVRQWNYFSTPEYGGPRHNEQRLAVTSATPSPDGMSVRLVIPGLRAGSVVHIVSDQESSSGASMWSNEAWYTLNQIPEYPQRTADIVPVHSISAFREPFGAWLGAGGATASGSGMGYSDFTPTEGVNPPVITNGNNPTTDLSTLFEHGDVVARIEFMIPEGSNSGVYFQSRYEIQIFDSHGKVEPDFSDMGGIYQRWDPGRGAGNEGSEGVPPRVNAALPAGEWNRLDVVFRAPRFDPYGHKIANARFESVTLNSQLIHENIELTGPTRGGAIGEVPFAPLRLQGDHGPVAYRNILIRPLRAGEDPSADGFSGLVVDPLEALLDNTRVLVFSKTAGFRHDSIPTGIECFKDLATEHGFAVDVTEDATEFNATNLKNYDAVVFLNTTGDVLDDAQQGAFEAWYRAGGGYLGIHSAADTEYDWPWYGELVGTWFKRHPQIQPARMVIATTDHPATAHLGGFPHYNTWTRTDEWYDFRAQPADGVRTLLTLDAYTYTGGSIGDNAGVTRTHPIAWCRAFDGGRTLYTGGGHRKEAYSEPDFRRHLLGALAWVMGKDD